MVTPGKEKETRRTQITNVYSNKVLTGTSNNIDWAGLVGRNNSSVHKTDRSLDALKFMGKNYFLFAGKNRNKNSDGFGIQRKKGRDKAVVEDICDGNAGNATATPPIPARGNCEVKTEAELQMLNATMTEWGGSYLGFWGIILHCLRCKTLGIKPPKNKISKTVLLTLSVPATTRY